MVRITITIPEEMKADLEKEAKEQDRSVSWMVREIIQRYFDNKVECVKE